MTEGANIENAEASGDEHTDEFNNEMIALRPTSYEETGSDGSFPISEGENSIPLVAVCNSTATVTLLPRPLVRRRTTPNVKQEDNTIMEALIISMHQEQLRRDEEQ